MTDHRGYPKFEVRRHLDTRSLVVFPTVMNYNSIVKKDWNSLRAPEKERYAMEFSWVEDDIWEWKWTPYCMSKKQWEAHRWLCTFGPPDPDDNGEYFPKVL